MVQFKDWQCRHCLHWHDWDVKTGEPAEMCINYMNTVPSCYCDNWDSINNLLYLESLAIKKKHA